MAVGLPDGGGEAVRAARTPVHQPTRRRPQHALDGALARPRPSDQGELQMTARGAIRMPAGAGLRSSEMRCYG